MYYEFFGFNKKPFELLPNPEFLYPSLAHKKALNYLEYGIQDGAGFILFTGEVVTLGHHLLEDGGAIILPSASPQTTSRRPKRAPASD